MAFDGVCHNFQCFSALFRCKHNPEQYAKRARGLRFLQKALGQRSRADLDKDLEILELLRNVKEQDGSVDRRGERLRFQADFKLISMDFHGFPLPCPLNINVAWTSSRCGLQPGDASMS